MAIGDTTKPKHRQLYEELGQAIENGSFVPGQRLPTEAELMQQYGVSRTTVTRTLRDLEHRGVIWRRRGSGTFVKVPDAKPAIATDHQYGMLVHGVEPGSIFLSVYEALARAADDAGSRVLMTHLNARENLADEAADIAERMVARGVRGVFFLPHGNTGEGGVLNRRVSDIFTRAGIPIVLLDRDICDFPQRSAHDLVGADNIRGGYLLGQHLIDVGCRRTLFFSENVAFSSARGRWTGYRAAMEANGIDARSFGGDPESATTVIDALRKYKPDGIVCDNDRHAAIFMRHLLNAKVSIPAEIKLAGFDDTPTASLLTVPLTTVRQPAAAIAQRAMSVMADRIAHPHLPPAHVAVHCELIVRGSTASPDAVVGAVATNKDSVAPRGPIGPAAPARQRSGRRTGDPAGSTSSVAQG